MQLSDLTRALAPLTVSPQGRSHAASGPNGTRSFNHYAFNIDDYFRQ